MSGAIEIILIFLVLANLILLGSSRLRNAIRIVAWQGLVLGLLPLLAHRDGLAWAAVLLGAGSAGIKGFVFPALLNRALRETIRDTGCTLKAFRAEWTRSLPMQFRGMHRFLPALMAMAGARIEEIPVNHRPRAAGTSKYTNWGRLKETLWDLWAVRWMQKRYRTIRTEEIQWKR